MEYMSGKLFFLAYYSLSWTACQSIVCNMTIVFTS